MRALIASRGKIEAVAGPVSFELPRASDKSRLILEGGQGFVPTHSIEEVMARMRNAAVRGAEAYLRRLGRTEPGDRAVRVTYEKLHNVAFDGDPRSESMRNAEAAARACGLQIDDSVLGWVVSCDGRLSATEYPGMDVLTFGPGQLEHAHSDNEQIVLDDIRRAVEFLALLMIAQTGTIRLW